VQPGRRQGQFSLIRPGGPWHLSTASEAWGSSWQGNPALNKEERKKKKACRPTRRPFACLGCLLCRPATRPRPTRYHVPNYHPNPTVFSPSPIPRALAGETWQGASLTRMIQYTCLTHVLQDFAFRTYGLHGIELIASPGLRYLFLQDLSTICTPPASLYALIFPANLAACQPQRLRVNPVH
jgi:hypothetical protein